MVSDRTTLSTRRAVMGAALGAAAATAAAALLPRESVDAADGGNLILGQTNSATSSTLLANTTAMDGPTFEVQADWAPGITSARAIQGDGAGADGVWGMSSAGTGVFGSGATAGVRGEAPTGGLVPAATPTGIGVAGFNNGNAPAVLGQSEGRATGVIGFSGGSGVAIPATPGDTGVEGIAVTAGRGVHGFAGGVTPPAAPDFPTGVYGESTGADPTGVWGEGGTATTGSTTGVYGEGDTGVWGFGGWGVFGATDATGTGVYGFSGASVPAAPSHTGVFGYSDSGIGVSAKATTGVALSVNGKAQFSRSGRLGIGAGKASITKTLAGVTTGSLVIAVLQTHRTGYYVAAAVPATGKFTVYLNKAVTATTYVAYFIVN